MIEITNHDVEIRSPLSSDQNIGYVSPRWPGLASRELRLEELLVLLIKEHSAR